jgi:2-oxoisovalerate dehydrogenase E1 component
LVHAKVPLLGHHTSGVRKDFYREDHELEAAYKNDPGPLLKNSLLQQGVSEEELLAIER